MCTNTLMSPGMTPCIAVTVSKQNVNYFWHVRRTYCEYSTINADFFSSKRKVIIDELYI